MPCLSCLAVVLLSSSSSSSSSCQCPSHTCQASQAQLWRDLHVHAHLRFLPSPHHSFSWLPYLPFGAERCSLCSAALGSGNPWLFWQWLHQCQRAQPRNPQTAWSCQAHHVLVGVFQSFSHQVTPASKIFNGLTASSGEGGAAVTLGREASAVGTKARVCSPGVWLPWLSSACSPSHSVSLPKRCSSLEISSGSHFLKQRLLLVAHCLKERRWAKAMRIHSSHFSAWSWLFFSIHSPRVSSPKAFPGPYGVSSKEEHR